ncbi:MAG: hypothetical protein KJ890_15625 [Gammaproteobacteria bacterium]|nr:hypothetical protein [Gammaproteobacteria bacterium]MBU1803859.1 hypothetical protein [Gammaproteobacteria bacterium]
MTDELRKEFEEFAPTIGLAITKTPAPLMFTNGRRVPAGGYILAETEAGWLCYQRSRAALTIKLPPAPEWPDPADHDDMDFEELEMVEAVIGAEMGMLNRCREAIRSKGVTIE